jgi:hypothetical protein
MRRKEPHVRYGILLTTLALALSVPVLAGNRRTEPAPYFTTVYGFEAGASLVPGYGNDYVDLRPGAYHRYEGWIDGAFVELEVRVLDRTERIDYRLDGRWRSDVARVVEEREWIDGEPSNLTWMFYGCSARTGDVYRLGERELPVKSPMQARKACDERLKSWRAGEHGARPGLHMPSTFLIGARYYQEQAPGVAMERAEHVGMALTVRTPAGAFDGCVSVMETSDLDEEDDEETLKVYARGVGLVRDGALVLTEYGCDPDAALSSADEPGFAAAPVRAR